jgi:hypothetical protein
MLVSHGLQGDADPTIDLFASRNNHKLARFTALPGELAGRAEVEDVLIFS